jgi:hypothetical protein
MKEINSMLNLSNWKKKGRKYKKGRGVMKIGRKDLGEPLIR